MVASGCRLYAHPSSTIVCSSFPTRRSLQSRILFVLRIFGSESLDSRMWFRELGMRWCMACLPSISYFFKLQRTSIRLRQWSKKLFGNARIEILMANEIIHCLDMA
jgi:hypothetical protein